MGVRADVRLVGVEPAGALRGVSDPVAPGVDTADGQRSWVRVGADDGPVGELAAAVRAVQAAVARREQDVGARALQRGHHQVEGVAGVVRVVPRVAGREVPPGREGTPAVTDDQGPLVVGHRLQHAPQVGVSRHGVREQPAHDRRALLLREQDRDVDQRRLRCGDEGVEGAHGAVADRELARLAGHSGRIPAPCRVDRDRTVQFVAQVLGVDAGVGDRQRDTAAVQVVSAEFGEEVLHVLPVADRSVPGTRGRRLDDRVGGDADDLRAAEGQHGEPAGGVVVVDLATDQDGGVFRPHGEPERLGQGQRVPLGRGRHRPGQRHWCERLVQLDAGHRPGDILRGRGELRVGDGLDDVAFGLHLDEDTHDSPRCGTDSSARERRFVHGGSRRVRLGREPLRGDEWPTLRPALDRRIGRGRARGGQMRIRRRCPYSPRKCGTAPW